MPEIHATRRDRLRAIAAKRGLDAVLVTALTNIRYLTGFTGSNAVLAIAADGDDIFGTDFRYLIQSAAETGLEPLIDRRTLPAVVGRLADRRIGSLGYESHIVTVDERDQLAGLLSDTRLESIDHAVEESRAIKDEEEIELLRHACRIGDAALAELLGENALRGGRTEREIARDLDNRMLQLGADAISFDTIVASGEHSAIPHHSPTDRPLVEGDFLTLDFGAEYRGYHADMTRTFTIGGPTDWQTEIYELVAAAQAAGRDAVTIGVEVSEVDRAARDVIAAAGHGAEFGHGLGHGVGLEIHEAPSLAATGTGTLAELMTVTVEPGVYVEGRGGVRIEDTLVVRADGPELLTMTPKDLTVLPAE